MLEDIYHDYTYVSQLKYIVDENSVVMVGDQKKRAASTGEGYGFLPMEAKHRFRMKSLKDEREAYAGK